MNRSLALSLLLMGIGGPAAFATSITYVINFTTASGTPPLSGSFTYDNGAVPAFTGFTVNWLGIPFDLTSAANSPSATGACAPGGAANTFSYLSSHLCGGTGTISNGWNASVSGAGPLGGTFTFQRSDSSNSIAVSAFVFNVSASAQTANGDFTITAVPEPASAAMILAGAALLGYFGRRGRKAPATRVAHVKTGALRP